MTPQEAAACPTDPVEGEETVEGELLAWAKRYVPLWCWPRAIPELERILGTKL